MSPTELLDQLAYAARRLRGAPPDVLATVHEDIAEATDLLTVAAEYADDTKEGTR